MAQGKKSFTAYCDWKETFEALPDELAGKLVKHLFSYVNDENPECDDVLINAVFANIKNQLKRDLKKWEEKRDKNRENARKRWDKKNTNVCERIQTHTNGMQSNAINAVTDTVTDTVKEHQLKIDDDVLYNVNELKKHYLSQKNICEAVIKEPKNMISNINILESYLNKHCDELKQQGRHMEKWTEFTRYFINSCRAGKFTKKAKTNIDIENWQSNPYNDE